MSKLDGFNKKLLRAAKKPKMIAKFVKMYNNMCPDCKRLAFENSKRDMEDYCYECQLMMDGIYNA